jgi:hypothetical protein
VTPKELRDLADVLRTAAATVALGEDAADRDEPLCPPTRGQCWQAASALRALAGRIEAPVADLRETQPCAAAIARLEAAVASMEHPACAACGLGESLRRESNAKIEAESQRSDLAAKLDAAHAALERETALLRKAEVERDALKEKREGMIDIMQRADQKANVERDALRRGEARYRRALEWLVDGVDGTEGACIMPVHLHVDCGNKRCAKCMWDAALAAADEEGKRDGRS